jgi:hypothetical protein
MSRTATGSFGETYFSVDTFVCAQAAVEGVERHDADGTEARIVICVTGTIESIATGSSEDFGS